MSAIRLGISRRFPLCRSKQIIMSIGTLLGIISITIIQFINDAESFINVTNLFVLLIWAVVVKETIDDDDDTPNEPQLI